jgi:CheY-like chemotaxis protein
VRLTQVFTNLLLNAARYSPAGAQIGVRLARLGDSEITVSVSDNGDGIPPDMLDHIFEPFVQLRTAATAASPGLGIGLALVRTLVELHGGEVIAHSQGLGTGSEFRVRLPALPPADSAGEPVAPESESAVASGQAGLRVMVCDDNQDAAQTLGFLMDELGFASRVVYSGAEALREAPLFRPHLLLLDIGMPGMDGYAVAQALSGMPVRSAMQVWALTGWGQAEDIARTASAGFDGHLVKPVSMVELDAVLSNLVTMRMDEAKTARTP